MNSKVMSTGMILSVIGFLIILFNLVPNSGGGSLEDITPRVVSDNQGGGFDSRDGFKPLEFFGFFLLITGIVVVVVGERV